MKGNSTAGQKGNAVVHERHGMSGPPPTNAVVHSSHNQHAGHSVDHVSGQILAEPRPYASGGLLVSSSTAVAWLPSSRLSRVAIRTCHSGHDHFHVWRNDLHSGCMRELSGRLPGMMTLISLAILVSFPASLAATLGVFEVDVWWELAMLISVMLLGHWLEIKAVAQARGALESLAALLPDDAKRVTESGNRKSALAALRISDVVLVRPDRACLPMASCWRARLRSMSP